MATYLHKLTKGVVYKNCSKETWDVYPKNVDWELSLKFTKEFLLPMTLVQGEQTPFFRRWDIDNFGRTLGKLEKGDEFLVLEEPEKRIVIIRHSVYHTYISEIISLKILCTNKEMCGYVITNKLSKPNEIVKIEENRDIEDRYDTIMEVGNAT